MSTARPNAEQLVLDAFAAYRLTRLATEDTITQPARERFIMWAYDRAGRSGVRAHLTDEPDRWQRFVERDPSPLGPPKLATLATCRWCAGVWCALGVVAARRLAPRLWEPISEALGAAAAAALLAGLED